MPVEYVKELIGVELVIIQEYLAQLLHQQWHKNQCASPFQSRRHQRTTPKDVFKR